MRTHYRFLALDKQHFFFSGFFFCLRGLQNFLLSPPLFLLIWACFRTPPANRSLIRLMTFFFVLQFPTTFDNFHQLSQPAPSHNSIISVNQHDTASSLRLFRNLLLALNAPHPRPAIVSDPAPIFLPLPPKLSPYSDRYIVCPLRVVYIDFPFAFFPAKPLLFCVIQAFSAGALLTETFLCYYRCRPSSTPCIADLCLQTGDQ